jgi:hypothetical protein
MVMGQADIRVIYDARDITGLVTSVDNSGDVAEVARRLSVKLKNTRDSRKKLIAFENGKRITLYNHDEEIFTGVVFSHDITAKGDVTINAYDESIYLTKNTDTKKFVKKKASQILTELCGEFGVPIGEVVDTGYIIPKLILRDKSLYEMILTALTVTSKQTGKKFSLFSKGGRVNLAERKSSVSSALLENGVNIIDASYSQSIEDTRTKVKVVTGDTDDNKKQALKAEAQSGLASKFGVMMHLENADSEMTKSEIEQLARELLNKLAVIDDEASIEALGVNGVTAGTSVYVKENMTGIIGSYFVMTDSHTFANGMHTMLLTLSATQELPTLEYDGEEAE